jgi:hypothetical protein
MPILTGLAIGAAMGGGIAALQGGDVLKGALLGAAGGGLGGAFMPAVAGAGAGVAGGAGGASGAAGALGGASGAGAGASLYSTGLGAGLGGSSIPTVAQLGTSAATGSTLGAGIGGTTIPTVAQLGTSAATGAGGAGASGLTALMSQFKYPLMGGVAGGLMSETPEQATMPEQEGEIRPYEYSEELNPNFGMPGQPYYSSQTFTPKTPVPYEDFTGFKQGGIAYLAEGGEPKYTTPVRTVNPDVAAYNTKIADQARYEYVDSPQLGAFQSAIPNAGAYNPEAGAALQALRAEQATAPSAQANQFGYRYDPVTGGVIKDESNMPAPAVANNSFNGFQDMMLYGNFNGGNGGNGNDGTGDSNAGNNSGQNDGGNSGGCVDPDVMVLMADRTEKRAGDVQVGDMVYAPHQDTLEYGEFKVLENEVLQQPKLLVKFEDASTIIISDTHKFLMDNSAWKQMLHIKLGDVVRGLTGHKRIIGMEYIGDGDVIRFNIDNAHTYISDGLISHNSKKEGGLIKRRYAQGGIAHLGGYSDGGQLLKGPGDGVSDNIPATISGKQPARLADGEFVVPARIVSELGNGSTDAGARRLYEMMNRVQSNRSKTVGKDKIAVDSKARRMLPA